MTEARASPLVTGAVALSEFGHRHLNMQPELLLDRPLGNRSALPLQARRLLHHVNRNPGVHLPRAACIGLAALITYQCATLYGVIVTPLDGRSDSAVRLPPPQPATLLASFDPFFPAGAGPTAAPVTASDLTLYGLRQEGRMGGGSAIISQSDGAQRSFGTGEEIASGIVLKQIGFNHVVVSRHGLDERLSFKDFESTGPAAAPSPRTAPSLNMVMPPTSAAPQVPPRPASPRGTGLPARSVDFADPSTIPASLTTPKR